MLLADSGPVSGSVHKSLCIHGTKTIGTADVITGTIDYPVISTGIHNRRGSCNEMLNITPRKLWTIVGTASYLYAQVKELQVAYFACSARAVIPAARGVAADVPLC